MRKHLRALMAMTFFLLLAGGLCAQGVPRSWKPLSIPLPPGVQAFEMKTDQPLRAWLVIANIGLPRLECRPMVSRARLGKEPLESLARSEGALIAVNASFFDLTSKPCRIAGWLVLNGKQLSPPLAFAQRKGLKFPVARAALLWTAPDTLRTAWVRLVGETVMEVDRPIPNRHLKPASAVKARVPGHPVEKVLHAVGAGPMLVRKGKVHVTREEEVLFPGRDDRHPRTVVGLKGKKIYLMIIDGRQPESTGASLLQTARLIQAWGVEEAMNLDGGGSSTLIISGKLINRPLGGTHQRKVPAGIGIFRLPPPRPKEG